jgi:hypothetical protein
LFCHSWRSILQTPRLQAEGQCLRSKHCSLGNIGVSHIRD